MNPSRARYERFVKDLRASEEKERRCLESKTKVYKENYHDQFDRRSERRSIINKAKHHVDLCMATYEQELDAKRKRLKELIIKENELDIRKFTENIMAGAEQAFQDKKARLEYLLAKRKKERDEICKKSQLNICEYFRPEMVERRSKDAEQIQLYQMREKQMRKLQEREMDQMWYEVAMKEADALAARMELYEIKNFRLETERLTYTQQDMARKQQEKERQREKLKEEALRFMAQIKENERIAEEEAKAIKEKAKEVNRQNYIANEEMKSVKAVKQAKDKLMQETWNFLNAQKSADDRNENELKTQIEKDVVVCNSQLAKLKNQIALMKDNNEEIILNEGRKMINAVLIKKCQDEKMLREKAVENAIANKDAAIKRKEIQKHSEDDSLEYKRQVQKQLDELVKYKQMTVSQAQKIYGKELLDQIELNKLKKEQAKQEEKDQLKKLQIAREEHEKEINEMLGRPYRNQQHPFLTAMEACVKYKDTKQICNKTKYW